MDPFNVLALVAALSLPTWRLFVGSKGFTIKNFSHLSFHRSSWLLLAPLLTPPVPVITAPPCSLCPEGAHRFQWIRNLVPEFGISSSHVKVLSSPAEFYELLKVSCGFQVAGMVFGGWELQRLWRIIDKLSGRSMCRLLVQPAT